MLNQLKLPYLVESSMILAIGYIVYVLLFASDKAYIRNRIYLLSLLLLSFLLPLISLPVYAQKLIVNPLNHTDVVALGPIQNVIVQSSFDWSKLVSMVYLGVVVLLSIRLVYHIIYISHVIKNSESKIIDGLKQVITDRLSTPASIFHILITDNASLPQAVIDHEKVHMRHGHTWDVLFLEIAKIVLWFNPFVYLTSSLLKENHEYIADHLASRSLNNKLDYASILLQYAKDNQTPILLNTFSSITKKRIIMLSKQASNNPWKTFLVIPALCGIVSLFSFDTYTIHVNAEGAILTDSIPGTRLDTVIVFNPETGEESMTIERVYVNEITTWTDTTVVFNLDTKEEKIQITKSEAPRTEVLLETYTTNEFNPRTGDLETRTYHRYPQEMMEVTDTVVTFNYDTYEEQVQVVKAERVKEKLVSIKVTPKDQVIKGQKFDNVEQQKGKVITRTKGNE